MGADIFRGRDIALQSSMTADGKEYFELVPVDGGYENASYSTIAAAVSLCQERGVPADTWPIYYGVYDADVPIEEVRKRCESLRLALVKTGKRIWTRTGGFREYGNGLLRARSFALWNEHPFGSAGNQKG